MLDPTKASKGEPLLIAEAELSMGQVPSQSTEGVTEVTGNTHNTGEHI